MRILLTILFSAILVCMVAITTAATMERSIFDAGPELLEDRWFQATLCDAYFGFFTFYAWVAYKERKAWSRILWLILIMCLGTIAMSIYLLVQLAKLPRHAPLTALLLRSESAAPSPAATAD